jgi:uncharacterized protein YbbC (DUF1343 family)
MTASKTRTACAPLQNRLLAVAAVLVLALAWLTAAPLRAQVPKLPLVAPVDAGLAAAPLARIDDLVASAVDDGKMPGCVILVARHGKVGYFRAFGHRCQEPTREPMTTDTLFDMASLTKPVATATSILFLVERGGLALNDRVSSYLPDFARNDKDGVTLEHLLVHQGGLIADNPLADYESGPEKAVQNICNLTLSADPGTRFVYSDVGFIVLGEIVHKMTGQTVAEFSRDRIFLPLAMTDTGFLPAEDLKTRAAPTEQRDGRWMRGEVHDPRAWLLGGVAGHAGLFSTAADMAVYGQMLLGGGNYGGTRVLARKTVEQFTEPRPVSSGKRALGWDVRTGYSINRGQTLSPRAFGHGGFTGTVMWIDPELDLVFIFLSNRLHPDGKGLVNPLAGQIGTLVGAACREFDSPPAAAEPGSAAGVERSEPPTMPSTVLTGIDVLERESFSLLQGRRVGLITNSTGKSRGGLRTADILKSAPGVQLTALFSPEHGFEARLDRSRIDDSRDEATGLPVYSLYGTTRKPTPESLSGIDTLVFDIQDVGARYYTYLSTMGLCMEAAAENGLWFVVLDRPNPINGAQVEGPVLDEGKQSFVGFHPIPVRHGMTLAELAHLINRERDLKTALHLVRVEGWSRRQFFDETGLLWINPSPNMRSPTQALLYPGIGLLETTNVSVGRGTDSPFEIIGAPWMDGRRLAARLNARALPGVSFTPIEFTPESSTHADQHLGGIRITVTNREVFRPVRTGLHLAVALRELFPEWDVESYGRLLASDKVMSGLREGNPAAELEALYNSELNEFLERRGPSLLYE